MKMNLHDVCMYRTQDVSNFETQFKGIGGTRDMRLAYSCIRGRILLPD